MKLGQSSFEYILIIGVAMLLLVPGTMLFLQYSERSGDELVRTQIDAVGKNIIDSVEKVYYIGENSWETVRLDVPQSVKWMYILNNSELVVEYDSSFGVSHAVFYSDINMTTPYRRINKEYIINDTAQQHGGLRIIKVISMGGYVLINESI